MKKPIKLLLLGIAALIAIGSAIYYALAPTPVPLTNMRSKTVELSFTEEGLLAAGSVIKIYPMTSGSLTEISVEEGRFVRSGDLLCVIDDAPLQRKIKQIRGNIRGHEAQIMALEAQDQSSNASIEEQTQFVNLLIAQAQKELNKARDDLARTEALHRGNAITEVALSDARATVTRYEFAVSASKQALSVIAAGAVSVGMADYHRALIEVELINIEQLEKDIENCRVTAAANGILTMLYAKGANYASTAAPVAEITVLEGAAIEVYVSTRDLGGVKVGDDVALTLKRRDGDIKFAGKVNNIAANAEMRVSALGLEEQRVKVKISPDLRGMNDARFGVGYNVDVRFILYSDDNKFAVPKTALFKDNGKDMLWLVRNGRVQAAQVAKGMELRTEFVIESEFLEGDAVVTDADNDALRNGLKVIDSVR